MFRIRKTFKFEAAHQLSSAFSEACTDCIHGHSYTVEVFLASPCLNEDEMVMDFGLLSVVLIEIQRQMDHALILPPALFEKYKSLDKNGESSTLRKLVCWNGNPTAESMARTFFHKVNTWLHEQRPEVRGGCIVEKVRVHETATGWAEYVGAFVGANALSCETGE